MEVLLHREEEVHSDRILEVVVFGVVEIQEEEVHRETCLMVEAVFAVVRILVRILVVVEGRGIQVEPSYEVEVGNPQEEELEREEFSPLVQF